MKYTYPQGFSLARAQELAVLVNEAYKQLDQGAAWQPPVGYQILAKLSAKEIWRALGPLATFFPPVVPPVLFGFVAKKGKDLYVIIRGTKTPLEWFDDITAAPVTFTPSGKPWGRVTRGFKMLYDDLGLEINNALAGFAATGGSLDSIYVSGHSLGAALAHLTVAGINAQFGVHPVSYTFSGPRAGEHQFASAYEAARLPTWRIFNTEDIVPTVPPSAVQMASANMGMHGITPATQALSSFVQLQVVGYQHVGYPIGATFHRDLVADNHSMELLVQEIGAL